MVSCDNEIRELDSDGKTVRVIKDLPGVNMAKAHAVVRLSNGNSVICFYQGSYHLIEVTPKKELVWKWRMPSQKTVVSVQILDEEGDASRGQIYK